MRQKSGLFLYSGLLLFAVASLVTQGIAQPTEIATEITQLPGGRANIQITNNSTKNVTAVVVTSIQEAPTSDGHHQKSSIKQYRDSLITTSQKSIAPGAQVVLGAGGLPNGTAPVVDLKAGIFDDGTTFGNPTWVQAILLHRNACTEAIGAVLGDVDAAGRNGQADIVSVLKSSLAEKLSALRSARDADVLAIRASGLNPMADLFAEQNEPQEAANVKLIADDDQQSCYSQMYGFLTRNLAKPPSQIEGPVYLSSLVNALTQQRIALVAAKSGKRN